MATGQYVPVHAVARPELLRHLDEALDRPVTLVVAQAGAGKSVLLTQWLRTLDVDTVWLDITDSDNDEEYFVRHLRRSITQPATGVKDEAPTVRLAGPGLAPSLVDDLEAIVADAPPCVVVLDDVHNLRNASLLGSLETLFTRLPPTMHVILSSRADPPIAWGTGRLRGQVGEIRQAELALNDRESAALLYAVSGVTLDDEDLAALVERTEGWAAGLQLAAMTLRRHPDPSSFVAQFSGSDRLVADYLSEQVVRSLPENLRDLIFAMGALDRMCDDLVAHVSDDPGARSALRELDQASMFLIALDEHQEWFRFHQLFRDLLRYQSRAGDPQLEDRVALLAAEWHLTRGEWEPTVEYLLRAREWDRAIDLILQRGSDVFERGEIATVLSMITRIPEAVREPNIDLSLMTGILIALRGRADAAEDTLRRVAVGSHATPGQRACAETFLASLAQWRPDPEASIDWAVRALAALDSDAESALPDILRLTDAQSLRTMATVSAGRAHFLAGHIDEARQWLERSLDTQGAAYSLWRISALGSLAVLEAWIEHAQPAEDLALRALDIARNVSAGLHPATAEAHLALGLVALARGDETQAAQWMEDGWLRAEANRRTQLEWVCYAASRALSPPLTNHEIPAGPPPPVAADRITQIERRGVHPQGWVAVHIDPIPDAPLHLDRDGTGESAGELADPLTDREFEILAYLPTRITTTELASLFYISVNTIKTHLAHIYQKLDVSTRRDAVTRATELGLLRW